MPLLTQSRRRGPAHARGTFIERVVGCPCWCSSWALTLPKACSSDAALGGAPCVRNPMTQRSPSQNRKEAGPGMGGLESGEPLHSNREPSPVQENPAPVQRDCVVSGEELNSNPPAPFGVRPVTYVGIGGKMGLEVDAGVDVPLQAPPCFHLRSARRHLDIDVKP